MRAPDAVQPPSPRRRTPTTTADDGNGAGDERPAGDLEERPAESARFIRVDRYGPRDWVQTFRIQDESDIDDELVELLREARAVGDQEHLRR